MIYPTTRSILLDVIVSPLDMTAELFASMAPFFALFTLAVIVLIIVFIKINKRK